MAISTNQFRFGGKGTYQLSGGVYRLTPGRQTPMTTSRTAHSPTASKEGARDRRGWKLEPGVYREETTGWDRIARLCTSDLAPEP